MSTLVVGVGNPDRGDDAAGLLVVERLRGMCGLQVRAVTGDLMGILVDPVWTQASRVIVVDSVTTAAVPGTVVHWEVVELLDRSGRDGIVTHELGLVATLQLADRLGRLPPRLTVVGIEAASFGFGAPPSPAVLAAVDTVVAELAATGVAVDEPAAQPRSVSHSSSARTRAGATVRAKAQLGGSPQSGLPSSSMKL